jgi:glucokinase-like ROK family protein
MSTARQPDNSSTHPLRAPLLVNESEAEVLRALRQHGEVSRSNISSIVGWSKAKTTQEIRSLINRQLIIEVGEGISEGGRRPHMLRLNPQLGYLLGIDIGATSIDICVTDGVGVVIGSISRPADVRQPPAEFLANCCQLAISLLGSVDIHPEQVLGIGVGVPGPVDFSRGTLVAPPLMPDWENFPIRGTIQPFFPSAFVVVDNDVNIMAIAEMRAGDGVGLDHFLFIKIGTGIGCGIISNGRVHRGSEGCAGDIGHICVDKNGPLCRCGNYGCLEAMAGGQAITEKAIQAANNGLSPLMAEMMKANGGILHAEDVNAACREGDQAALDIIRSSGQMIGDVLASLVNFFNPSHIFIGGGITNFGNHLMVSIRRAVLRRSLPLATTHLSINYSRLGAVAGMTGAIALAREYLFMIEGHPFRVFDQNKKGGV